MGYIILITFLRPGLYAGRQFLLPLPKRAQVPVYVAGRGFWPGRFYPLGPSRILPMAFIDRQHLITQWGEVRRGDLR